MAVELLCAELVPAWGKGVAEVDEAAEGMLPLLKPETSLSFIGRAETTLITNFGLAAAAGCSDDINLPKNEVLGASFGCTTG